jgi:excisionase family DNA binding protein
MEQTVLISMPVSDLQSLIMDCVSTCLTVSPSFPGTVRNEIEKPLGGVSAAAEFLNLEEPTIYSLVQSKRIPFHKPSKKIYFYASELNEWVKSGKGKTLEEIRQEAESETLFLNKSKRA